MARIAADVTWLVGRTPLVELSRLSPPGVRIVGKLESWNPSGSNKDRAALGMIQHAARTGALPRGGTIVECSSGDLGIAIATMGRRLGYRVVITMPEGAPAGRRALLTALGAEVAVSPASLGMRGAMARAEEIAKQTADGVCLQAFTNKANTKSHVETTAREIWEDTDGRVAIVVVPIGSGGTASGAVAFFRDHAVPVVGVEPLRSPVVTGGAAGPHDIPGLGAGFIPDILCPTDLAEVVTVADDDAIAMTRALAREECLLGGPASGAVLHAAVLLGNRPANAGKLIVAVLPDSGERYLDHRTFAPEE
jgi:cysteine synthase A